MPAPGTPLSSSSISSSGHVDGLGRRSLSFDRETGAMLERVHVRPEIAVFEQILRQRVERLSTMEEERFARPSAVERDPDTGELSLLAEFITGSRLSELLEVSSDTAVVPGVDVALGYLVEGLSGLSALHTTTRTIHGLIDPSRTVLTADGQVVFLDLSFSPAIERLHLSADRLWREFGISCPTASSPIRFDVVGDVTQVALNALMLVLGRSLKSHEYPDGLPSLVMEVIEVAHIRGSTGFADGLQRFLQRSLPLPGRRPYLTAEEALADVRQLVRREIGLDACRQAVIDFVAQMDASFANTSDVTVEVSDSRPDASQSSPSVPELDSFLDHFDVLDEAATDVHDGTRREAHPEDDRDAHKKYEEDEEGEELELSLDHLDTESQPRPAEKPQEEEVYDLQALDEGSLPDSDAISSALASFGRVEPDHAPVITESDPFSTAADTASAEEKSREEHLPETPTLASPAEERSAFNDLTPVEEFERALLDAAPPEDMPLQENAAEPERHEPVLALEPTTSEPVAEKNAPTPEPVQEPESAASSRRRKRQQKSARARKDKLRSTTADQKAPAPSPAAAAPPPTPPPARPAAPTGWLVSPQRAAASESLIPDPVSLPPPPPPPVRHVPAVPSFVPTPVGPLPQPTYANPSAQQSAYGKPTIVKPPPPPPPPPPIAVQPQSLKLKAEPPPAFTSRRPDTSIAPPDRFSTLSLGRPQEEEQPRAFPWKLAAIAVGVAVIAIVVGRAYLPGRTAVAGEPGAQVEPAAAGRAGSTDPSIVPGDDAPIPEGKGRVLVQTQPPGIKVLIDRKPVGDTPVRLDLPPGRRVLTFLTSGGEVLHSVRIVAGKTVTLDIPVFSGWVSVIAPFALDIEENGRRIGTTEQNRIILPPGRHKLTLRNKELEYSSSQDVDIEPGGVRSITINPKGTASINANPWAEVWLEGTKLGETPLASTPVPLGIREFVFKHPQYGERRVTATIRGSAPATISVDFTK